MPLATGYRTDNDISGPSQWHEILSILCPVCLHDWLSSAKLLNDNIAKESENVDIILSKSNELYEVELHSRTGLVKARNLTQLPPMSWNLNELCRSEACQTRWHIDSRHLNLSTGCHTQTYHISPLQPTIQKHQWWWFHVY